MNKSIMMLRCSVRTGRSMAQVRWKGCRE
jgi:hypothetical protein